MATLISPLNTSVTILEGSRYDISIDGFKNQSLLSLATWGENPIGDWTLKLEHRTFNSASRPFTLTGIQ